MQKRKDVEQYSFNAPKVKRFVLTLLSVLLVFNPGETFDRSLDPDRQTKKPRILYCPILKAECIGRSCFKWFGCLRDRYNDFHYMLNDRNDDGSRCPPDLYLKIMEGRIKEPVKNLKEQGCYSGDMDTVCGEFTLCDKTKEYADRGNPK